MERREFKRGDIIPAGTIVEWAAWVQYEMGKDAPHSGRFVAVNDQEATDVINSLEEDDFGHYDWRNTSASVYEGTGIVINKTPHAVHMVDDDPLRPAVIKTYPKDETPIRLAVKTVTELPLPDGTKTSITIFGEAEGLPDYKYGVYYIVSQLVKSALPDRKDLLVPAEVVRDKDGNIIGCKSLGR